MVYCVYKADSDGNAWFIVYFKPTEDGDAWFIVYFKPTEMVTRGLSCILSRLRW